jgi:hypothetical protein
LRWSPIAAAGGGDLGAGLDPLALEALALAVVSAPVLAKLAPLDLDPLAGRGGDAGRAAVVSALVVVELAEVATGDNLDAERAGHQLDGDVSAGCRPRGARAGRGACGLDLAGDVDGVSPDHAADLAKAMLDRALARIPDDLRRYLRAASWPFQGCELCEEEARQAGRPGGRGGGGRWRWR